MNSHIIYQPERMDFDMPMHMDIIEESEEPLVLSFVGGAEHGNVNGVTHGGVLFYLCDEIVGRYVTRLGRSGAAAEGSIHFYRPALLGKKILISISERKSGKRLGTYLVELRYEDGTLVADALFTVAFGDGSR